MDLHAKAGRIVGILGPNGAGKTTLIRAALGLVPFDGHIDVDGKDVRGMSSQEQARCLAYVPQRSQLAAPCG